MTAYDKLLVTHGAALRRKYGGPGADQVRGALDALVAADDGRGLESRVVDLDNYQSMRAVGAARIPDGDWVGALRAVDRACARYDPSYVVLVGATDVVPQAQVDNPFGGMGDDLDPYVPSDLPFACDLPEDDDDHWRVLADGGRLDAGDLLAVTRVVGRLPDLVGATDPAFLLGLLGACADPTQRPASAYEEVFALTAAAWRGSTRLSARLLPGPTPTVHESPPATTGWPSSELAPLLHLVNCHGGDTTPDWYGQETGGPVDTVALRPEDVDGRIGDGTVVAAECCFGAMHQDPTHQGDRVPMMWAYLRSGACAAVGSASTAYGPADGNGQADLVCRYFLEGVVAGASAGRALLEARQRFVRESGAMAPEDLKTLAQFDLLGDPSLQPVALPGPEAGAAPPAGTPRDQDTRKTRRARRRGRRQALAETGRALDRSVSRAGGRRRRAEADPGRLARRAGLREGDVGPVTTYGEHRRGPRRGTRYHVAPLRAGRRGGFVSAREVEGELETRVVLRR